MCPVACYFRNIRALRTLHIVRKTLCRSHRIVHTFGLVSFHHTPAHTFGLNKLHSSALMITSSHSSPTNKLHSSHHPFKPLTRYTVFLSLITSSHSSPTKKLHSSHHPFKSYTRYAVLLSLITSSHSSPTNDLRSSHPFKSFTRYVVFLFNHPSLQVIHKVRSHPLPDHIVSIIKKVSLFILSLIISFQSSKRSHSSPNSKLHSSILHSFKSLCLIHLPPTSSAVHPFKSFTRYVVFLFNHPSLQVIHKVHSHPLPDHIVAIIKKVSFVSHQQAPQFHTSFLQIILSHSSPTNKLHSSSLQVIHKVRHLSIQSSIPSSHSQGTQSSSP